MLTRHDFLTGAAAGAALLCCGAQRGLASEGSLLQNIQFDTRSEIKVSDLTNGPAELWFNEGHVVFHMLWEGAKAVGCIDTSGRLLTCCLLAVDDSSRLWLEEPFERNTIIVVGGDTAKVLDTSGEVLCEYEIFDEDVLAISHGCLLTSDGIIYDLVDGSCYDLSDEVAYLPSVKAYEYGLSNSNWDETYDRGMGVFYVPSNDGGSLCVFTEAGMRWKLEYGSSRQIPYFFDESFYPVSFQTGESGLEVLLVNWLDEQQEAVLEDFTDQVTASYSREGLTVMRTKSGSVYLWNVETNDLFTLSSDYATRIDWSVLETTRRPLYNGGRLALPINGDDGLTYVAMFDEHFKPLREPVRADYDEEVEGYGTKFSSVMTAAFSGFESGRLIVRSGTSCHEEGSLRGQDITVYNEQGEVAFEVSGDDCYMFGDYHEGLAFYASTLEPEVICAIDVDGNIAFKGLSAAGAVFVNL